MWLDLNPVLFSCLWSGIPEAGLHLSHLSGVLLSDHEWTYVVVIDGLHSNEKSRTMGRMHSQNSCTALNPQPPSPLGLKKNPLNQADAELNPVTREMTPGHIPSAASAADALELNINSQSFSEENMSSRWIPEVWSVSCDQYWRIYLIDSSWTSVVNM